MPVVAVGAAIAATAVAADTIATVGFTLTAALEVTAAVGATVGAIGQVTGNQDLAMAGMALGIVGGVGALASSAGLFGSDASSASLFGTATDTSAGQVTNLAQDTTAAGAAATPADQAAQAAAAGTNPAAAATAGAAGTQPDIIDSMGNVDNAAQVPAPATGQAVSAATGNASQIVTAGQTQTPLASALDTTSTTNAATAAPQVASLPPNQAMIPQGAGVAPPASPAVPTSGIPASLTNSGDLTASDIAELNSANPAGEAAIQNVLAGAPATSGGNILSSIQQFAKDNPLATYGLIQAAGSFAQGAFNPLTPAQLNALNAQAAANNAAASLTNTQVAAIQSGVPSATTNQKVAALAPSLQPAPVAPVTGTPQMPSGLINSATGLV